MRRIHVLVREEQLDSVTSMLEAEGIDHVRQRAWHDGTEQWMVEIPVPTDAIGYVLEQLEETGIDREQYTTVTSLESAMTPRVEALQERFADDFDPLTRPELRSKARDISRDRRSLLAMVLLSTIIAVAGLLIESTAVVVGAMVIAPLVGPVLTAAVGAVTNDREMLLGSLRLQGAGLVIALAGALAFSYGLKWSGFFPSSLAVSSIDLIALRIAPNFVTIAIGLAAGAAGAYGLMTKGPTSLIGVMIAAALIPAAATVGIAAAWGQYRIALGSLLLLLLSLILINVAAFATLRWYYHPEKDGWLSTPQQSWKRWTVVGTAIVLAVLLVLVGAASFQQIAFEHTVNAQIEETLQSEEYEELELVTARIQYTGGGGSPATVSVGVTRPASANETPSIADELDRRITDATGREVEVEVQIQEYQRSSGPDQQSSLGQATATAVAASTAL